MPTPEPLDCGISCLYTPIMSTIVERRQLLRYFQGCLLSTLHNRIFLELAATPHPDCQLETLCGLAELA